MSRQDFGDGWQKEVYRIWTLLEAWYFQMTQMFLILFSTLHMANLVSDIYRSVA